MGDNDPMDAFVSFLHTPWAVVVAVVFAVLIGVVIRLAVSARRPSTDDVTITVESRVSAQGESPTPIESEEEPAEQPRAGPTAENASPVAEEDENPWSTQSWSAQRRRLGGD